jgi:hypothetical protein
MLPGVYNFNTIVQNDLYPQTTFTFRDASNDPINLTGQTVSLAFIKSGRCHSMEMQITNPTQGQVVLPEFIADFDLGIWEYQLKISQTGSTQTYLTGTLQIVRSIECQST